jgi:regulator of protease activity HflC (stomatin/prohibitin superfamily)
MEWLSELIQMVKDMFPWLYIVDPQEGGVRVTLGRRVKTLGPGWYFFWPIFQSCTKINVVPQVVDLRPQSGLTSDLKDIVISGGVRYKVIDARKAILNIDDYDKDICIMSLGIICDFVNKHPFGELKDLDELAMIIRTGIAEEATGMGLKIMKVYITDIGSSRNIRMLGEGSVVLEEE